MKFYFKKLFIILISFKIKNHTSKNCFFQETQPVDFIYFLMSIIIILVKSTILFNAYEHIYIKTIA